MKPILAVAAAVLLFPCPLRAAEAVFAENIPRPVSAFIALRADYLGQVVRLSVPEVEQTRELSAHRRRILDRLGQSRQVTVVEDRWTEVPPASGIAKKGEAAGTELTILLPLTAEDRNHLDPAWELAEVVRGLDVSSGKVRVDVSPVRLASESPEQYRPRLLEMINEEAKAAKGRLGGAGRVTVGGLEGPVRVRRAGELLVEVYLQYRLEVETP